MDLSTFVSCRYNYAYNSDDYEDTDFNSTHILAYRNCTKCPVTAPFSYGYQDKTCQPCSDFSETLLENADPYLSFYFEEACGVSRLPVTCWDGDDCYHYPDEVIDYGADGDFISELKETAESGSVSQTGLLILTEAFALSLLV